HRQKKARQAQDLTERIQRPPGPVEQQLKHTLPLENGESTRICMNKCTHFFFFPSSPASFPLTADVFEDDVSSSSSPKEQHSAHQSPTFSSLPRVSGDQLLSDCSALVPSVNHSPCHAQTARPPNPACSSSLPQSLNFTHLPRPRKPRDTKPKMRKLKYHQYIPPDQRGGPNPTNSLDPAYSDLLKQQQVFLQLQILQSQQQQQQQQQPQEQITVVPRSLVAHSVSPQMSSGAIPQNPQPVPATTNHTPTDTNTASKPELLPANLVDLTVSELRQQLRKRGLPVSGTKPALLQRLRPFQLPSACLTPAPLCQLGTSLEPLTPCPSLPPSQSPGSTPASTASGTPSPSLPMSSSSPLQCGTPWRTEKEQQQQQQQQQQELSVELEMRERIRSRPRDHSTHSGNEVRKDRLRSLEHFSDMQTCICHLLNNLCLLSNQVFCCQPCDAIGHDFELPVQITASPTQNLPCVRSLEEELQEAIQKAQMDPRQSIDDILDEPFCLILCTPSLSDSVNMSDHKSPTHSARSPSPPQNDQSQTSQQHNKDDNSLLSPLCSSLLLELPPSPAVKIQSQVVPLPPPPPICTSPLPSTRRSRKRRAPTPFDAADWLEILSSGLRPLTPPTAPFVEPDLSLDSDLNVSRVLDLMIEQW
uniref:Si:dkeyp-69b9.3 n=1 Tax=Amphilophus citrinellus TaxID=61819 RepID=A0A3Q0RAY0_AMPCI